MKTKNKILTAVSAVFLLLLMTWGILETAGSGYYSYKGYVVNVRQDDRDQTIITTISGDKTSKFVLKWYSREKYKKEDRSIAIGDLVMLSTTQYSDTNIKKISVNNGYSTEGKLVYLRDLPDRPFILATDPTTRVKYLISIVPTDTDLFDDLEMGESVRIFHSYPLSAQSVTVLSDAQAINASGEKEGLTDEEIAFIEEKGYTVKE